MSKCSLVSALCFWHVCSSFLNILEIKVVAILYIVTYIVYMLHSLPIFSQQEPHCHVWWIKMNVLEGKRLKDLVVAQIFVEINHGSLSYVVWPFFPECCNIWKFLMNLCHKFGRKISLARVSKLPMSAFGSTVAGQDLEEGQMGLVEVKEQLTRDSLHQQPLWQEGASYGNGRLGANLDCSQSLSRKRSRWLQFRCAIYAWCGFSNVRLWFW